MVSLEWLSVRYSRPLEIERLSHHRVFFTYRPCRLDFLSVEHWKHRFLELYENADGVMLTFISDFTVFFIGGMQNWLFEKTLDIILTQKKKNTP